MVDEDNYDADRYDSAAGWDGRNKRVRQSAKRFAQLFPDFGENPFELAAGGKLIGPLPKPSAQLFGPLWHQGELAILAGPAASGKSVLAVQIADAIARGKKAQRKIENGSHSSALSILHSPLPSQKVLYIDFERTQQQFAERYSAPHPLPGKLPLRHRFPRNFIHASLAEIDHIPETFKGDTLRFILYWLHETIETSGARVVIIDNLSYLARSLTNATSAARLMKTLRLWATRYDLSILATVHSKLDLFRASQSALRSQIARPLTLAGLTAASPVADLADTVFAIAPSTCGADIRYIKHLKSRNATLEHNEHNVIVCQLTREAVISRSPASMSLVSSSPASPTPFLSLQQAGFSDESAHLIDHVKQAQLAERLELEQLRRSKSVVNMLMSREYKRYLER